MVLILGNSNKNSNIADIFESKRYGRPHFGNGRPFNSKKAVGEAFGVWRPPIVFCPSPLIFETITVKFCDF